jgi:predicted O-methyltransferase YrrM
MDRQLLKETGTLAIDNALYHGLVVPDYSRLVELKKKTFAAVEKFNQHLLADTRIDRTLLTVRDGIMLVQIKKK